MSRDLLHLQGFFPTETGTDLGRGRLIGAATTRITMAVDVGKQAPGSYHHYRVRLPVRTLLARSSPGTRPSAIRSSSGLKRLPFCKLLLQPLTHHLVVVSLDHLVARAGDFLYCRRIHPILA